MSNKTYNIETCIANDQVNMVFTGYFLKPAAAYLEHCLETITEDQHAEIILNMKDLKHITGQCMQVIHGVLSKIYTTKKIVLICRNGSQIESLFLHLGFAQWFSFFEDQDQLTKTADTHTSAELENTKDEELLLENAA